MHLPHLMPCHLDATYACFNVGVPYAAAGSSTRCCTPAVCTCRVRLLCAPAAAALLLLAAGSRLEVVADAERLTCTVLEVLPVCSPAIQQQLVGFLPEVVLPQDHEVRGWGSRSGHIGRQRNANGNASITAVIRACRQVADGAAVQEAGMHFCSRRWPHASSCM
jgi:hypothetical protein